MIKKRVLSLLMMLCIFGAALVPLEDAYAEAAGEKQSSFEYKQYKDQNQYRNTKVTARRLPVTLQMRTVKQRMAESRVRMREQDNEKSVRSCRLSF